MADGRPGGRASTGRPDEEDEEEVAVAETPAVYIVTTGEAPERLGSRLAAIEGARLVRALPPRRVVVALRSHADRALLAALPGVEGVVLDRLEHPDRPA
jgi:hypothetical protein